MTFPRVRVRVSRTLVGLTSPLRRCGGGGVIKDINCDNKSSGDLFWGLFAIPCFPSGAGVGGLKVVIQMLVGYVRKLLAYTYARFSNTHSSLVKSLTLREGEGYIQARTLSLFIRGEGISPVGTIRIICRVI